MRHLLVTTALLMPLPAVAQDAALVLGNQRYEQLDNVRRGDTLLRATDRFDALGFDVFARANARASVAKDLAAAFQQSVADADRLVVALSGHFVTDGARTWLLTPEASAPDLFTVDDAGLSVDSILSVLAARPGQAVLLMGGADPSDLNMRGSGLRAGIGDLDIPQGVTVIETTAPMAATVISGPLTQPRAVLGQQLPPNPSLAISGYFPPDWTLMPGEVIVEQTTTQTGPTQNDLNVEAALWDRTTAEDSVVAYRTYVARYPQGRFAAEAEAQIRAILGEPNRSARLAEDALGLNRTARRAIQSNLTLLNYNTRGVDGLFGPGSRGAITNWQQSNGFPQTSYLTRDQISLLDAQAGRRQAELDAAQARATAQAEARDRDYWSETGARGDEPGYRAYLARYPEGLFSNIARARLGEVEDRRSVVARAADRSAWAAAERDDDVEAYQDYIAAFPSGEFVQTARARITERTGPSLNERDLDRARAEENNLRLTGVRAQLLELRLRDLGHNPGRLDGVIDTNTRRAIQSYQVANGLPGTGYVDQQTAVGLMTGSIRFGNTGR